MHRMDVRQQPTQYGAGTSLEPEKALGTYDFPDVPRGGQRIELRGEQWEVTEVHDEWVYVTPLPA